MAAMRIPLWVKVAWTAGVAVWLPVYWRQYGAQNFLYFCDLGNLLIVAALWSESCAIFSWQANTLLLFQTLYVLDLSGAMLVGRHFIGGTEYMFDPAVPRFVRLLSLFHLLMPPLLLWAIWRLGYDPRSWKYATLETWVVAPVNYFWRPQYDINWARGLFLREQHTVPGMLYLAAYLVLVPTLFYWPTHLALKWWAKRFSISNAEGSRRPAPAA
jgi:hypothetical protein